MKKQCDSLLVAELDHSYREIYQDNTENSRKNVNGKME
jgi:hypothetical protein